MSKPPVPPPPMSSDEAKRFVLRFKQLFTGNRKAYGEFSVRATKPGEKVEGDARTIRGEPTLQHYADHLYGRGPGLGIIPIREDGTALFGAIDYDDRNVDHLQLERSVRKAGLPLVVCRSKSGGAHLYLFCVTPVPAPVMRRRLSEFCKVLGLPRNTEIFPKQDRLIGDELGNWINLPYYGLLCR